MSFTRGTFLDADGTYLLGSVTTTRAHLTAVFGDPFEYGALDGDGKVTTEWTLVFDDGTVATIYDWKRYEMGAPGLVELYDWHIGGRTVAAEERVLDALSGGVR